MYKFKKGSRELAHFKSIFSDEISVKTVNLSLLVIFFFISISFIIGIFLADSDKSEAITELPQEKTFNTNARTNNFSYINTSNELCKWECYPKSRACYRRESPPGSDHYDVFTLVAHTSMGDAIGDAYCHDPGLCEPGNYDILGCRGLGGVPGDSEGWCEVVYDGYSKGYHYWKVYNEGHQTTSGYQRWEGQFKSRALGYVDMRKWTSWQWSYNYSDYSFKGCKYYIYSNLSDAQNRTNPVDCMTLDKSGYAKNSLGLYAEETYYIRESNKPGEHGIGYKVNEEIAQVTIKHDDTVMIRWGEKSTTTYDEPYVGELPFSIAKTDSQTLLPGITQGSAPSLENALYKIEYREGANLDGTIPKKEESEILYTWIVKTDENGKFSISEKYRDYKIDGDDFIEKDNKVVAPIGTYYIEEILPPEGYLVSPKKYVVVISPNDYSTTGLDTVFRDADTGEYLEQILDPQTGEASVHVLEQVIRGDYKFTKVNEDREILAGIPFKITSKSTGEWHIAVTDKNGIIDTSSNHYLHTKNTNCNDVLYDKDTKTISDENALTANSGIWFALNKQSGEVAEPNDNLAALPYDEYLIEEIVVSRNEKYLPFESKTFVVENDSYKVEGDTWVNYEPVKPVTPETPVLPQTGDWPYTIIGLSVVAVLCYITRRWVYYRKY